MRVSVASSHHASLPEGPSVFEQLLADIIALRLPPGTPLSRVALQQQFRLSSTPIRDALIRLELAGLVDIFPQSGTRVSLIDVALARQAQFLRRSIEQEVVRVLATSADAALIAELRSIIANQRNQARDEKLEEFNQSDLAFHKALYDAAGVSHLWSLVREQSGHVDRIRRLHLPIGNKANQIIRDHSQIVNAIAKQDSELAQLALRNHLSRSLAFSDELRIRFPSYFTG